MSDILKRLDSLSPENRDKTTKRAALSVKFAEIARKMTAEINEGKYAAAVDAFQEFWSRTGKAAKEPPASAAEPTTRP